MKTWNQPTMEELDLSATAYGNINSPCVDGSYTSTDGKYTKETYGGSCGVEEPK